MGVSGHRVYHPTLSVQPCCSFCPHVITPGGLMNPLFSQLLNVVEHLAAKAPDVKYEKLQREQWMCTSVNMTQ